MKKILVIEDEKILRDGVCEMLRFEGYEVLEAENGKIGIELAGDYIPDLVLCDIMMPEIDGYGVLASIRSNQETKVIPVILITAMSERENIRTGMEKGAEDYLTKPFTQQELLIAVKSQIAKAETAKELAEAAMNELRGNMIVNLPHELKTPLNGMMGYGEMLKDTPERFTLKEISEMGSDILESSLRLNRLIQNYLTYARLELSIVKPDVPELPEPEMAIERIAKEISEKYRRPDDLQLDLKAGQVFISRAEWIKIVEEIIDNAFKFSFYGATVRVSCGLSGGKFFLKVEDTGRGMSPSAVKRIGAYMQFERKIQAQQGSGLGLIISQKIVELFRGHFSVESQLGKGTTVFIQLPGK